MSGKKDWFYHARIDLLSAKTLFELPEPIYETVGFHLQQCMEKAIKGYLHSKGKRFPKTHNIGFLLTLLEKESGELADKLDWARDLTDYGVYVRYPDAVEVDLSHERVKQLMELTKKYNDLILEQVRG